MERILSESIRQITVDPRPERVKIVMIEEEFSPKSVLQSNISSEEAI